MFLPISPPNSRLIVAFISYFPTRIYPARIPIDCCVVCVASHCPSLLSGGDTLARPIVSSLVLGLSGDIDQGSSRIAAYDTVVGSGGIRDGVGGDRW